MLRSRLHKKTSIDHNIDMNFRLQPSIFVQNYRNIEMVVAQQLTIYIENNGFHESLQSAYRKYHSTESAAHQGSETRYSNSN